MKDKKWIIIVGIIIVVVVVALLLVRSRGRGGEQVVSADRPTEVVLGFYNPWLEALKSGKDPYDLGLAKAPILSRELSDKLVLAGEVENEAVDPVLCQATVPSELSVKVLSAVEDTLQVFVSSAENELTGQAIVTLNRGNGGWYINKIECSLGEFEAPREFTFETEGYLLKDSVPAPFNKKNWHLVFEQNGVQGHVVPLLFSAKSNCKALDGKTSICNLTKFIEAKKVFIQGSMTEAGAEVKNLEFKE